MKNQNAKKDANRDPITCEPGAHPVGTGIGSAAAGATGAAIGAVAGPVGAGVGAVAGAIAGGLAGKGAAEKVNPTNLGNLREYIDYVVVDKNGNKIGTVDAVWEDHTGQPAYLAVRTGWLGIGRAHVIPTPSAEVSGANRKIRLPYSAEEVKAAPSFDCQSDITIDSEREIRDYYVQHGWRPEAQCAPQVSAETTAIEPKKVQLKEETINVGKREVEYGGIKLRKIVRTEVVNQPIELKREEIVIDRVAVPGDKTAATASETEFKEEEIFIPLRREEAVVSKEARVREEVRVGKKARVEKEEVSETIRKEDVEITEEKNEFESSRLAGENKPSARYQPKERSRR